MFEPTCAPCLYSRAACFLQLPVLVNLKNNLLLTKIIKANEFLHCTFMYLI